MCDKWWEPETDWHRSWKNNFPIAWQEIIKFDSKTNEKHIADVFTEHGLVIEFQHSHLKPEERMAREKFYQNMIWVVDGTRLKRDYPRFQKAWPSFLRLNKSGFFCLNFPEECFPSDWLGSTVPVIFDFQGLEQNEQPDILRNTLWCLLPGRAGRYSVVVGMARHDLVKTTSSRAELLPVKQIIEAVTINMQPQQRMVQMPLLPPPRPRYTYRRRKRF